MSCTPGYSSTKSSNVRVVISAIEVWMREQNAIKDGGTFVLATDAKICLKRLNSLRRTWILIFDLKRFYMDSAVILSVTDSCRANSMFLSGEQDHSADAQYGSGDHA